MPPHHRLRLATDTDFDFIMALRTEAYQAYVERHFDLWDDDGQRDHLRAAWQLRDRWIIEVAGQDVGYLDLKTGEPTHLGNIIVHPDWRGRGLATQILSQILRSSTEVRLQVFRDNPAVALYRRLGFTVVSQTAHQLKMCWTAPNPRG